MNNTEHLHALTESYLKSIIAQSCQIDASNLDVATPFTEMGIDSFYVLKLVKQLEQSFGTLPKTLLFEYFNIQDLAGYFIAQHPQQLQQLVGGQSQDAQATADDTPANVPTEPQTTIGSQSEVEADNSGDLPRTILALEKDALATPGLGDKLSELFGQYKNEGSVSRGTRNIAQNLFIGSKQKGFFNYGRSGNILLAYAYTGPKDYFNELVAELFAHCRACGLEMNILTDEVLQPIDDLAFSSTPFGVVQRVLDIDQFSLAGSSMRRLRYQVSKFEKAGKASTCEYQCGSDSATDQAIAAIIDMWCAERTMVNPLIHIVKDEIINGKLDPQHRLFLTYLGDKLQNVILISKMVSAHTGDNGYLMDLEFYPKTMPLGGLEFGIVNIIESLAKEGCNLLSLGGTYGCKLPDVSSEHADPALDKVLEELREQNVFNDAGNMQFKNKFRPENKTIYLCRALNHSDASNVIDIIMMIADPERQQSDDSEHHTLGKKATKPVGKAKAKAQTVASSEPVATVSKVATDAVMTVDAPRVELLQNAGFNPLNVALSDIAFEGKTDSWAQLKLPAIERQMKQLHSQIQTPRSAESLLESIFGFSHFVLADSGRHAEHLFYSAIGKKGVVLSNLMFPTAIFHQIDNGFTPQEIPTKTLFDSQNTEPFKGNLDLEQLKAQLGGASMVCIELINNAGAGAPVSLSHLKQVKALTTQNKVPLVLDVTRIIENALLIKAHETEYQDLELWQLVKEICAQGDYLTCSLAKNFCVPFGGLVATNDAALMDKMHTTNLQLGTALDVFDKKLLAHALGNLTFIERQVTKRKDNVAKLHQQLSQANLPLLQPAGGHCVVFDPKAIAPFNHFAEPAASFAAWLFLATGIRAGIHSAGMQQNSSLNQTVRLAVPVGVKGEAVDKIAADISRAYSDLCNIPEVVSIKDGGQNIGDIHSQFQLLGYHNPKHIEHTHHAVSTAAVGRANDAVKAQRKAPNEAVEIAVVGMSGRYPKASDRHVFWQNLIDGVDCVEQISEARMALRLENDYTRVYRGGFLSDVDRFDSLFFNISPREAEILDPQERLFLEVAYEAIEDAGYYPETLSGENGERNIGVFVGAVWAMYQMVGAEAKLYGEDLNPNSFLWSVANRVSYWMNLSGPSLTVDTACSSSLTALYLACEAIGNGECQGALVGGVNLDLHQQKYDINYSGGALSADGLCRTFGDGANGYVAGEGVGALFLKPLSQAIKDKDTVAGVIKSAVVNHGGRTSGYTVPNPKSQAALIKTGLEKAQIDPRTIGYIEAHGTGTELGDPIEIRGLSAAFEPYQVAPQSCAIGSVKTNIGHLEAAAGVVGVAKVLLQMKHRQLVPSLHSKVLNEHIDFAASPFVVQQSCAPWENKVIDGVRFPRRAGVSSFGAGGANAHILLEQFEAHQSDDKVKAQSDTLLCFPLSARTEGQLNEFAAKLKAFISQDTLEDIDNIAFTLQVGKKSFDHRLAILANSKAALAEKLAQFLQGHSDDSILKGNTKNAQSITRLLSEREKAQFVDMLSQDSDPVKMAKLWIDGLLADWQGMVKTAKPQLRRVPLPTYPFADKRHWLMAQPSNGQSRASQAALHPLIDLNESTFERQLFKKTFRITDFVIGEHIVSNIATLPGVAYLELARKAGELAAGRRVNRISNVLWLSPLTATQQAPCEAYIDLQPANDGVQFEVFSLASDDNKQVFAQGKLHYGEAQPAQAIDIEQLKASMTPVIDGKTAYPLFNQLGLAYGPSFQAIEQVYRTEQAVLGKLQLPLCRQADFAKYELHPALIDAAMQAGVAAQLGDVGGKMMVPYSLGEVEIFAPMTDACYSYITKAQGDGKLSRENLVITDAQGRVLVKINESVGVPIGQVHDKTDSATVVAEKAGGHASVIDSDSAEPFEALYYHHQWREAPADLSQVKRSSVVLFDSDDNLAKDYRAQLKAAGQPIEQLVLVKPGNAFKALGDNTFTVNVGDAQDFSALIAALKAQSFDLSRIVYRLGNQPMPKDVAQYNQALEQGVFGLLYLCQALIEHKLLNSTKVIYSFDAAAAQVQPHNEAVNGFVKSLLLENAKARCTVLQSEQASWPELLAEFGFNDSAVRYRLGKRQVRTLARFDLATNTAGQGLNFKHKGVYLITGGAGGLGLIFAKYLAEQCQARLVLTGRSQLNDERQADIKALEAIGAEVMYVACDVAERTQLQALIEQVHNRFGSIDGIVHSAGVLRDSFLRNKKPEEMAAVFAPKVTGTLLLDELSAKDKLDFFVTFSSLAALGGNAGQCDYAYANHFMDSFADARNNMVAQGLRDGVSVSLNWSLWADGGMQLDEQTELIFKRNLGIKPLATEVGVDAFAKAIGLNEPHLAVVEAIADKLEVAWGLKVPPQEVAAVAQTEAEPVQTGPADNLLEQVQNALIDITVDFLKLDIDDIEVDTILMDLGFDSIGLAAFANALNDIYQTELTPVVFFEYPNIREVAKHIAVAHQAQAQKVHQTSASKAASPVTSKAEVQKQQPVATLSQSQPTTINKAAPMATVAQSQAPQSTSAIAGLGNIANRFVDMPIAIVGMSGVMPQSPDLDAFWQNLVAGKDLVSEIPPSRWDWREFDGSAIDDKNKSYSRWGGFIDDVDKFDPMFFGITPREAQMMDPQQRILVQSVYHAVENAGQKMSDLSGSKTGFFVGVSAKDYVDLMGQYDLELDGYSASGTSHSILANRISFLFNLHGPSAPIDTACSSSLIALHRAIESIHTGSSDMALVAGVQVMLTPAAHIALSSAGMLSPEGKCKAFDKNADGYVRGEGVGVVFIKPLVMAKQQGNPIHAIVRATSENHGGKVSMLTAPNPKAQAELLVEAYRKGKVDPKTIGYIECHGTGTSLGDPIEIKALKSAFDTLYRDHNYPPAATQHCGLSAVKTNIGHLEPAAGMAGLFKAVMALNHKQIPPLVHFDTINPYVDIANSPMYMVDKTTDWQAPQSANGELLPRVAGVSSFGWGGANAHVVLQEYQGGEDQFYYSGNGERVFILSAKAIDRLAEYVDVLIAHLNHHSVDVDELAYTLQVGREEMNWRLGIIAGSVEQLREKLYEVQQSGALSGDNIDGKALESLGNVYLSQVSKRHEVLRFISNDNQLQQLIIDQLFASSKWSQLLELWVQGLEIDWRQVYGANPPKRAILPGYPFAKERHWLPIDNVKAKRPSTTTRPASAPVTIGNLMAAPQWQLQPLADEQRKPISYQHRYLIFAGDSLIDNNQVESLFGEHDKVLLLGQSESADDTYYDNAIACFDFIQQLFMAKKKGRMLLQLVIGSGEQSQLLEGLSGLLKTASLENPRLKTQLLVVPKGSEPEPIKQWLETQSADTAYDIVRYQQGKRYVKQWQVVEPSAEKSKLNLADDGVYLITGGLGGLGRIMCQDILTRTAQAKVILTGRSELNDKISDKIAEISKDRQDRVSYLRLDLSSMEQVEQAIAQVVDTHGRLNGIIHSAGMVLDNFIIKQKADEFASVLQPKVVGSYVLDKACAGIELDFMVLFSSLSGVMGNIGQGAYACANGFMDSFAHWRNEQVAQGKRFGHTLSINWPLWQQGGMGIAHANQQLLAQTTGMHPMTSETGLSLFYQALNSGVSEVVALEGEMPKVRQFFLNNVNGLSHLGDNTSAAHSSAGVDDPLVAQLKARIKADIVKFNQEAAK